MARKPTTPTPLSVETLTHDQATRKNIPTAEYQSVLRKDEQSPLRAEYARRNRDLDPQLVWRGKDVQDWSDLVVHAPPLYIQEKIHPKVLIDDLRRQARKNPSPDAQPDLFADFNGLPSEAAKTEFYQHDGHWANRMILGDSLQVMASLAEREGLRGQVQYHDHRRRLDALRCFNPRSSLSIPFNHSLRIVETRNHAEFSSPTPPNDGARPYGRRWK